MTSIKTSTISALTLILLSSCGYLFLRDVKCRSFEVEKLKLFPGAISDTISFLSSSGQKKTFIISDKLANHTTNYVSDTGCSCHDFIQILYTSAQDSIWYTYDLNYIYDQPGQEYFSVSFVLDGVRNRLHATDQDSTVTTLQLNGIGYDGVKKYVNADFKNKRWVKECYFADDVGLIKFERADGEVWTQDNPRKTNVTKESSNYTERSCK